MGQIWSARQKSWITGRLHPSHRQGNDCNIFCWWEGSDYTPWLHLQLFANECVLTSCSVCAWTLYVFSQPLSTSRSGGIWSAWQPWLPVTDVEKVGIVCRDQVEQQAAVQDVISIWHGRALIMYLSGQHSLQRQWLPKADAEQAALSWNLECASYSPKVHQLEYRAKTSARHALQKQWIGNLSRADSRSSLSATEQNPKSASESKSWESLQDYSNLYQAQQLIICQLVSAEIKLIVVSELIIRWSTIHQACCSVLTPLQDLLSIYLVPAGQRTIDSMMTARPAKRKRVSRDSGSETPPRAGEDWTLQNWWNGTSRAHSFIAKDKNSLILKLTRWMLEWMSTRWENDLCHLAHVLIASKS